VLTIHLILFTPNYTVARSQLMALVQITIPPRTEGTAKLGSR